MQAMELQTERTILRPFTLDDALHAFSWFGDQEVMKFTSYGYSPSLVLSEYLSPNLEYIKPFLNFNISATNLRRDKHQDLTARTELVEGLL